MSIRVVHLAWAGAGQVALSTFLRSYAIRDAGADHRLTIVWKGFGTGLDQARADASMTTHDELVAPPGGRDLTTYRWAATKCPESRMCFLNSSSEVLADGWLAHLDNALSAPQVGLAGASASYESARSAAPRPLRPLRRGYPRFPNPHLRTNAFMIDRERMLSLEWPRTESKRAAAALESGRDGLTAQIRRSGELAVVVGREGGCFAEADWPRSATFRSAGQENLLVADNRTRDYAVAGESERRVLRRMAWGDLAG